MSKDFIIVFGSAVSHKYRVGSTKPHDIDIITNMHEEAYKPLVNKWSKEQFGEVLTIDAHQPQQIVEGIVEVPVLDNSTEFHMLYGDTEVRTRKRNDGFASALRIYPLDSLISVLSKIPMCLSLIPEGYSYDKNSTTDYRDYAMDKYYAGLKAFRNAASHVENLDRLFSQLNCGRILKRLLTEDPVNWESHPEDPSTPTYGEGWSLAYTLNISTDKSIEPLYGCDEDTAMDIIFGTKAANTEKQSESAVTKTSHFGK